METRRLHFTVITPEDRDFFFQFYSSTILTRHLPKGEPYTTEEIDTLLDNRLSHWQKYSFGTYILKLKSSGIPIGYCGLEHVYESEMIDIRYGIIEQYWGNGLGFEAARKLRDYGFNHLAFGQIFGAAKHENLASLRIMEKLGMIPFDGAQFFDDSSLQFFRITRQQFGELSTHQQSTLSNSI